MKTPTNIKLTNYLATEIMGWELTDDLFLVDKHDGNGWGEYEYFNPLENLNDLALVWGNLSDECKGALCKLVRKIDGTPCVKSNNPFNHEWNAFVVGFTGGISIFAQHPKTLCRLIYEAGQGGKEL